MNTKPILTARHFVLLALVFCPPGHAVPGESSVSLSPDRRALWWEAEEPAATNFPPGRAEQGRTAVLSEGKWIGADEGWSETPFLEYEIEVPEAGQYSLYARKFWKHGPYRWRFDEQPWAEIDHTVALLDDEYIRLHWGANWTKAGDVRLDAGKHRLRIEVTDNEKPAYFDAFLLTRDDFFPLGRRKPWEPMPEAPGGWVNFTNYETLFDPSPIDLRSLNETVAGERGFIGVEGDQFVQDGRPIRFLGVGVDAEIAGMPREKIAQMAKFFARKGVNLVRYHSPIIEKDGPDAGKIDPKALDDLFHLVEAMKKEGIFTHISIYFPVWFRPGATGKFAGLAPDKPPFAMSFINRDFQEMEKTWWRALLTTKSPYSGRKLKDEPAVMGVEILNEDSLFFWTFNYEHVPPQQMAILEKEFGTWLAEKYGSLGAALKAWDLPHERDSETEGRAGFLHFHNMIQNPSTARARDTARFLAGVQRRYFDGMYSFLRDEIGFQAPICGSNWRTANTRLFGALDKWTQEGCDFFDHHGYYGGWGKKGEDGSEFFAGKSLSAGDTAPDNPRRDLQLPFLPSTIANKPGMVSEYAWMGRNPFRCELPLLVGSLASHAGLDAMVQFAASPTPAWRANVKNSWPIMTPSSIAQYPAKALVFRKGLVAPAEARSVITVNVEEMKNLAGNDFLDPSAGDANRAGEGRDESKPGIDPILLASGRVLTEFSTDRPGGKATPPTDDLHNVDEGRLLSADGQIDWQYKRGIYTVRSPQTQGVSGYLSRAGKIDLPDITVDSPLPFGVVWAVAMDGKPLAESNKILLQVMTEEQNTGFATEGEPVRKVLDAGEAPIQIRAIEGAVTFKRPDAGKLKVTALDVNGVPTTDVGDAARIDLRPDTIYYVIEPADNQAGARTPRRRLATPTKLISQGEIVASPQPGHAGGRTPRRRLIHPVQLDPQKDFRPASADSIS